MSLETKNLWWFSNRDQIEIHRVDRCVQIFVWVGGWVVVVVGGGGFTASICILMIDGFIVNIYS